MSSREWHKIWIAQCEAARDIRIRYGLKAALDYLVKEKLLNFAGAAANRPEFAWELPRFVSEVRRIFESDEIRAHIAQVERELAERRANPIEDEGDLLLEDPAIVAEQERRFALIKELLIKELLTAGDLGTSRAIR